MTARDGDCAWRCAALGKDGINKIVNSGRNIQMNKLALSAICGVLAVVAGPLAAQDAPAPAPAAPPARQFPPPPPPLGDGPWDVQSADAKLRVEVVTRGLDHPWGMAFLPDGAILVTERPGRLRVIRDGVLDPAAIEGLPPIFAPGIAGLTDIVLDPDFASNRTLYLSYSKAAPGDESKAPPQTNSTIAVLRARWDGGTSLTDVEDIFLAEPWYGAAPIPAKCCGQGPAFGSYGGRMAIDKDGYLYVTSGDRNHGEIAREPGNHLGKILRLNRDGSIPRDNPFTSVPGTEPAIWTSGHRNPTGLTIDPETGTMWETEFGPRGGDEVNRIERGANYGWPDVTQGYHYNGEPPAKGVRGVEGMTDPVWAFGPPSHNPGNVAVYRGEAFPRWNGDLLVAMMNRTLVRLKLSADGHVTGHEALLADLGQRLRDVRVAPDGSIYLLTDETAGAVLRITPGT
jgi:glucose/arabinose dehydrogenase